MTRALEANGGPLVTEKSNSIPKSQLSDIYRRMVTIRKAEEAMGDLSLSGELPGPVHLYIGQEATAVGVCSHLADDDWVASTHRGHGHFLAKGGVPREMFAEVFGKATGICRGMGGSMHVADFKRGILGANGIVGGGIGITMGAALGASLDGKGKVAVAFFGDGAANQGVLMEALNVASLWKLPIILVCENNGFSEFSPASTVTAGEIWKRAEAFEVPGVEVDGNDVFAVWETAFAAIYRARSGQGPTLIEAATYRLRGHVEYEHTFLSKPYRTDDEVKQKALSEPLVVFRTHCLENGLLTEHELSAVEADVSAQIAEAIAFAREAPAPAVQQARRFMFA